ncbi:MAG: hypothetical protein FJ030_05120 [Chloroflexi bacterium]|nr:hypothetical protein [Chloroflexota bacterium]
MTVWGWEGWLSLWMGIVVTTRTALLIARERESQNWPLLRVTPFDSADILKAKAGAALYWVRWPIIQLLFLRAACVAIAVANSPDITPTQTALAAAFALLFCAELFVSAVYNCSVGLTASAFAKTSAVANAAAYSLHIALFLFIFLPIWNRFAGPIFEAFFYSDHLSTLTRSIAVFSLLIAAQLALAGAMFFIAAIQLRRIVE